MSRSNSRTGGWCAALLLVLGLACERSEGAKRATATPDAAQNALIFRGGTLVFVGVADLGVADGYIAEVSATEPNASVVDVTGKFLVPAFIDSHVHLAYYEVATGLSRAGVAAALDLAAPLAKLSLVREPLSVINSGPMLTAKGGYPTTSWGRDGYGLEISSETEARDAVNTLLGAGAKVIKVAITQEPSLDRATLAAAVDAAHAHQLKVFAHALNESEAERAALANVDALAHTPTQLLSAKSLEYWGARSVVSTLSAFGGGTSAVQNLRALRAAGARVLYGTDLGNTRSAGIQSEELELLRAAGLDGAAIVAAGTQVPAEYLGFAELGALTPGKRASFMILDQDPTLDPQTLTRPNAVYINGKRVD